MASPFFTGARGNEDLTTPVGFAPSERAGYTGNGSVGATQSTPASPEWNVTGGGEEIVNGYKQGGTSAYDKSVDRYREMAAQRGRAPAPQLDQRQAGESRGLQLNALEMLRRQGSGEAPSASAIMAQRANQNAVMGAGQQVTGARSAGGALAALRHAGQNAGQRMLAGNAANAGARAGEISRGQGAHADGAGYMGGQDIGAATTNARLEEAQRAMNLAAEQRYERMAFDTRGTQLQNGVEFNRQMGQDQLGRNMSEDARRAAEEEKVWRAASLGSSTASDAIQAGRK